MKKLILKVELHDGNDKRKAMKTVSALTGIDSISMDMKEKKLVVIGTVDPIDVVSKLRKFWPTHIISVGPAVEPKKEEPKKEEPKKEEPKKEEPKKEEPKKEEPKKEDEGKKEEEPKKEEGKKEEAAAAPAPPAAEPAKKAEVPEAVVGMIMPYHRPSYYPPMNMNMNTFYHQYQPHHHSIEENPNACVIS